MKGDILKTKIKESNLTIEEIAERMGTHKLTLYCKLRNPKRMTIRDARILKSILSLSDKEAMDIFYSKSRILCDKEKDDERV